MNRFFRKLCFVVLCSFAATVTWTSELDAQVKTLKDTQPQQDSATDDPPPLKPTLPPIKWLHQPKSLFHTGKPKSEDDANLGKWEAISFGGEGDCRIRKGVLTIESGDPMTGIHLPQKNLPTTNYEIQLEARRTEGIDFFCGLTFPVNKSHCCLIVGGWSGAVVGLSNIDDKDASSNSSRRLMTFEDERWYRFRIRVMPEQIVVWIDDECVVDQNIKGKKISLRGDTTSLVPFGFCTFQTTSETRKLTIREFKIVDGPAKSDEKKQEAGDAGNTEKTSSPKTTNN